MEVIAFGLYILNGMVGFLAATRLGQFSIQKIDALLWTLEQIGKYSVQEDNNAENRKCVRHANMERPLSWPIFWILLIALHMFRVVTSMVLVKFNKKPIESEDIVNHFQKWRRFLRSIRFNGLQKIRQQESDMNAENTEASDTSTRHSKKKRYDDVMAEDLFREFLNHTFSETDDLDSTYEATYGSSEDAHSSSSSDEEEHESSMKFGSKSKSQQYAEDSEPVESDIPEIMDVLTDLNISAKSDEVTFESTICNLSPERPKSVVESLDFNETTETTKSNPNTHISEICENGKAILNQYSDPTDKLIAQLVALNKVDKSWIHNQL